MIETTENDYYDATVHVRDCDDDPTTVMVTFSPEDYGIDLELRVNAFNGTAYLTPEQAQELVNALTSAIGYTADRQATDH